MPLKRKFGELGGGCVGKTRSGKPCGSLLVYKCRNGALRCKWHGGLSTGPKSAAGKQRSAANLLAWMQKKASQEHPPDAAIDPAGA